MRPLDIKPGTRYGRWVTISHAGHNKNGERIFECLCDCGSKRNIVLGQLRSGHSRSCGCLRKDVTIERNITHGLCLNPIDKHLFNVWRNMMDRCYRKTHRHFKNWGGRGILVCDIWHDPEAFVEWGKKGYELGLTIERKDNNGNYEPGNCVWATKKEQGNNRRDCRFINFKGRIISLTSLAEFCGITRDILRSRLDAGWPVEKAISKPSQRALK